jgi:hypothetical protein
VNQAADQEADQKEGESRPSRPPLPSDQPGGSASPSTCKASPARHGGLIHAVDRGRRELPGNHQPNPGGHVAGTGGHIPSLTDHETRPTRSRRSSRPIPRKPRALARASTHTVQKAQPRDGSRSGHESAELPRPVLCLPTHAPCPSCFHPEAYCQSTHPPIIHTLDPQCIARASRSPHEVSACRGRWWRRGKHVAAAGDRTRAKTPSYPVEVEGCKTRCRTTAWRW